MKKHYYNLSIIIFSILGVLFGLLTILLHFFNDFLQSLADYYAMDGKCDTCSPATFELLNMFVGIAVIIACIFLILYLFYQQRIYHLMKRIYLLILSSIVLFLCFLTLLISANKYFVHDEFEHIHSAWYVSNNYVPYSDFFQTHHPLLWYSFMPLLLLFGNTVETIIILRFVMFILTLGIAFLTFLIARKITNSKQVGLLSVLLLLSMWTFVEASVEIRPDVPQVLFGLISIYYLIIFFQTKEDKHMISAGLAASISFLFLQKTVFLLIAYTVIFVFRLLKKQLSIKPVFYFLVCFSLPLLVFLGYLMISESFEDYVLTNWLLNMHPLQHLTNWRLNIHPVQYLFSPLKLLTHSLYKSGLFWPLLIVSVSFVLLSKKANNELKTITFIGLVFLASPFLVGRPWSHYFIFPVSLLCICIGYFLKFMFERFRLNETGKVLLIISITIIPLPFLLHMSVNRNYSQLEEVNFVLQNSKESDLIYDGCNQFNLYRCDLHYFWYSLDKNLLIYNELTNNRYGDYDICELIKSKKPKFISDYGLDVAECGLIELYNKTQYDGLYMRKEEN